jgi:hypothetical protein
MLPFKRKADFAVAVVIAVLIVAINPIGILLATGRLDFSRRVTVPIPTLDLFLLILLGAVLASGRVRRAFFHLLAWTIPLALLAAMEAGAVAIHLADRLMPLEDCSVLVQKYDTYAGVGRREMRDGLLLHRPGRDDDVSINELGLRTALPSPKSRGEWRIAVTGGSAAWGWRLRDVDTMWPSTISRSRPSRLPRSWPSSSVSGNFMPSTRSCSILAQTIRGLATRALRLARRHFAALLPHSS